MTADAQEFKVEIVPPQYMVHEKGDTTTKVSIERGPDGQLLAQLSVARFMNDNRDNTAVKTMRNLTIVKAGEVVGILTGSSKQRYRNDRLQMTEVKLPCAFDKKSRVDEAIEFANTLSKQGVLYSNDARMIQEFIAASARYAVKHGECIRPSGKLTP